MIQVRVPSLRVRLLVATLAASLVALALAGWGLTALFRDHIVKQFDASLATQLAEVTSRLEFGPDGRPELDPGRLSDPRWRSPYGGLYWQVDGPDRPGALRSRSLWDGVLALPADRLLDGEVHVHAGSGPDGAPVRVLERAVFSAGAPDAVWRVAVAQDTRGIEAAVERFRGQLFLSLLGLFLLLAAAAWVQVAVGLAPLRGLRRSVEAVQAGRASRLDGRFPSEVQPLVEDFNAVLAANATALERGRKHAGNLAHAVKTPLAVIHQSAEELSRGTALGADRACELGALLAAQAQVARRHVDWHLARSRSAGSDAARGRAVAVEPVVRGLVRVMHKVHAARRLDIAVESMEAVPAFLGEEQDLQEIVGNLLDNACKWARRSVRVAAAAPDGARLRITVEDDGPGLASALREAVTMRGVRLDESVPGSGLGLAIVQDLLDLYGGRLAVESAEQGGLRVQVELPGAPVV